MKGTGRSRAIFAACVLLTVVTAIVPGRLRGQSVEFSPYAGVVLPQSSLVQQGRASLSHRKNVAFGGRLDVWFWPSAGLEVAASYAPSGYHAVDTLGASLDTIGGLFTASARFVYRFARTGPVAWHVLAGAGTMTHSGAYIRYVAGKTELTGVLGVACRFHASAGMTLQLVAEDYVYSANLGALPGVSSVSGKLNNDVVLSLGLVVPLGARGDDDWRPAR